MARRIVDTLAALSLLVGVVTVALWVTDYTFYWPVGDVWNRPAPLTSPGYSFMTGQHAYQFSRLSPPTGNTPNSLGYFLGFAHYHGIALNRSNQLLGDIHRFYIPFWFVLLLTAPLPAWRLATHLRAKLTPTPGLCPKCGYDLRATPSRCPECGTVPA